VVEHLPINPTQWSWAFQSRLGLDEWLQPFADDEIKRLAQSGVKHLAVCCPAFVSDCLETLEEIGEEGKELFLENGGETFTLIPCLNDSDEWVNALLDIINETVQRSTDSQVLAR
jgi:ferrochelatase